MAPKRARSAGPADPRRRKLQKKDKDVDAELEKFKHGRLKAFYRALKKAKQFEVGKVKRRLNAAEPANPAASRTAPEDLNLQLAACKNADLATMTNLLAEQCGWVTRIPTTRGATAPATAAAKRASAHSQVKKSTDIGAEVGNSADAVGPAAGALPSETSAASAQPAANGDSQAVGSSASLLLPPQAAGAAGSDAAQAVSGPDGTVSAAGGAGKLGQVRTQDGGDGALNAHHALAVVQSRILAAKCVKDEVQAAMLLLAKRTAPAKDPASERPAKQGGASLAASAHATPGPASKQKGDAHSTPRSDAQLGSDASDASASDESGNDSDDEDGGHPQLADSGSESDGVAEAPEAALAAQRQPGTGASDDLPGPPTVLRSSKRQAALGAAPTGTRVEIKASAIKAKALKKRQRRGEDAEGDGAPVKRKGQRERRRLFEKMYGRDAKHLQGAGAGPVDTREYNPSAKGVRKGPRAAAPAARREYGDDAAPGAVRVAEAGHPSWAAKQQQKATLAAAPAGKKPMNGDSGGGGRGGREKAAAVPENLHPSWEAKKRLREQSAAQTALMARPQGKKLTFDSD